MNLINALRYQHPSCLAFVGAGGKTTALVIAARELITSRNADQSAKTVLVATTTHMGSWQMKLADHAVRVNSAADINKLEHNLPEGVVIVYSEIDKGLMVSLKPGLLEKLHTIADRKHLPLFIEADGSHTRPLKAPAEHEPAIPDFSQHVIVVAGLSGLGKSNTEECIHRPERFALISGLQIGEPVTSDALVKVLLDKNGGLKNIPPMAARSIILNQADTTELQSNAKKISVQLLPKFQAVIITSLSPNNTLSTPDMDQHQQRQYRVHAVIQGIAGIILAAGSSSRLGSPKQLLVWKGEPLIRHVIRVAIAANLSPVIVVLGSNAEEIEPVISDMPQRIVKNDRWELGISSSIKKGLEALPDHIGGAVFLQADQPQIPVQLINTLIELHQTSLDPIIAPLIDSQRGNPVLFDASMFHRLQALDGDIGGRALFSQIPVRWVPWHDARILLDIDTLDDFRLFLAQYSSGEE